MQRLYVGTSGWAYPGWRAGFYPPDLPAGKFLPYYARRLPSVEVNYTFRHLPSAATVDGWIAETPPGFRFAIKAGQWLTHVKRLKDPAASLPRFLDAVQPLADAGRRGPVLFQLPPDLRADVPRLAAFLAALPRGLAATFEFRHPSWFVDEVYATLHEVDAALCVAEAEKLVTPDVATASFAYYRFRRPTYTEGEQREITARLRAQLQAGRTVYAFFKHEESAAGALCAEAVGRELADGA
ncbi:MAG TPA: DUF72 domain-containing protein [Polyangia bacterium]|jgi:uncharacterized protein YecE (DUF72 family)